VIARCTIVEMPREGREGFGLWKVERVIYGKLPVEQIRQNRTHTRLGASRVFCLVAISPEAKAAFDYRVCGVGSIDMGEVQGFEHDVVEIVESGMHLTPPDLSSHSLGLYVGASSRIVRAKLRTVGTSAAEGKVLDELRFQPLSEAETKGINLVATASRGSQDEKPADLGAEPRPTEPGIVRVGLEAWRLRAETVAGYHADRDAKGLSGNNFVRFMVAITLRVMIRPRNCEVVSGQALSEHARRRKSKSNSTA